MNSIRNRFESGQEIIQNIFDIFFVCQAKIDSSFPNEQFVFLNTVYFKRTEMLVVDDCFPM